MNLTVDPWTHILESLNPDYNILKSCMDAGPFIKPRLAKFKNKWHVELEECWPENVNYFSDVNKLDRTVEWCTVILENWPDCNRISWDTWEFNSKRHAEKFITYYNIACPQ